MRRPDAYGTAIAGLVAIAVAGGGVFAYSLLSRRPTPSLPPTAQAPEWLARSPHKSDFVGLVVAPKTERERDRNDLAALLDGESRRYAAVRSGESHWSMTRLLPRGYEFDSRFVLSAPLRSESSALTEFHVTQGGGGETRYRAEVGEQGIDHLQVLANPEGGQFQDVALRPDLPLSIGDLRIRDVVDLYAAVKAHAFQPVGDLETFNAVPLKVFEFALPARGSPGGTLREKSSQDYAGDAASALLYCEVAGLTPRTLRFFDVGGRLVRTYTDLIFAPAQAGTARELRLLGFRVESVPTDSSSVFHLESAELKR